jgi:CheY-like chemotaxis protein
LIDLPDKILIVDDDPDFIFILDRVLGSAGYDVISAGSGTECLEKVQSENPDLVILDIMMPDMNGWDVCKKIKETLPDLPVSMCSILKEPRDIEKSLKHAGADEHITKPLIFDKFLETVNSF